MIRDVSGFKNTTQRRRNISKNWYSFSVETNFSHTRHPTEKSRVAFSALKNNFKKISAVRNILRFWPLGINVGALQYAAPAAIAVTIEYSCPGRIRDTELAKTCADVKLSKIFRADYPQRQRTSRKNTLKKRCQYGKIYITQREILCIRKIMILPKRH